MYVFLYPYCSVQFSVRQVVILLYAIFQKKLTPHSKSLPDIPYYSSLFMEYFQWPFTLPFNNSSEYKL